jgi:hypothetical protein
MCAVVIALVLLLTSVPAIVGSEARASWNLLYDLDVYSLTGVTDHAGAEFDGTYFYVTQGASSPNIEKYSLDGQLVDTFSIPGVPGLQDLAFDGTYFYGGDVGNTIYVMDFSAKTLVGTIASPILVSGIAYDPDLDAFYVSWWSWEVDLIGRDGTVLQTIEMDNPANARFGLAYDNVSPGGPYLWVFDQGLTTQYERARVYQWNLSAGEFTGFYYDVGADLGSGWGIAKGLFTTYDYLAGAFCVGGIIADSGCPPVHRYYGDYLFIYMIFCANSPPETPAAPSGPSSGFPGGLYSFTAVTTDPDGDDLSYTFDWGDGTTSSWLGPVPSGSPINGSHFWVGTGTVDIRVKAKDTLGAESSWSEPHKFTLTDVVEIGTITGGLLRIKAEVKNLDTAAATNLSWSIALDGHVFMGKGTQGTIPSLEPGATQTVSSKPVLGFGPTVITVTAGPARKTQNATVLLFYIKI